MHPVQEAERARVVATALSWVGTPYCHRARIKGAGVDCGQFIAAVFNESGIVAEYIPLDDYRPDWMMHRNEPRFKETVERYAKFAPLKYQEPGDIALFRWGRSPSHGAIVIEWPKVVHSYIKRGVIISNVQMEPDLTKRYVGVWDPWKP
jgi:NlpC/P60 family putative phage cell wall peptidase